MVRSWTLVVFFEDQCPGSVFGRIRGRIWIARGAVVMEVVVSFWFGQFFPPSVSEPLDIAPLENKVKNNINNFFLFFLKEQCPRSLVLVLNSVFIIGLNIVFICTITVGDSLFCRQKSQCPQTRIPAASSVFETGEKHGVVLHV